MSGLEGLGAVASVFGIIGVVKTSIDLLDIITTVRSAERDLEDLFVHLQWQRIRFYCWLQETGFSNIIAQHEMTPESGTSELLNMLPHELRPAFVLSHIQRSIRNMNSLLKTATPLLQRYSTRTTPDAGDWNKKLRRGLDPNRDRAVQICSEQEPPSIKFNMLDKIRWVAAGRKQLTELVEQLRNYNTELKEILPLYKALPFERRINLVAVTSQSLAARMAAIEFESQLLETIQKGQQITQYRDIAQMLQRSRAINCAGDDESNLTLNACDSTTSSTQLSLYRNKSEFKFATPAGADYDTREFATFGSHPVVIEWRYYSSKMMPENLSTLDIKIHMLTLQLQQLGSQIDVNILNCLGHFHDKTYHRYGIAFDYPKHRLTTTPTTLQKRLLDDHKRRIRRDLEDRFRAAQTLIATTYRFLAVNWLHKNLCSRNIVFFEDDLQSGSLESPYVCGFDFARRDVSLEMTEDIPSSRFEADTSTEQRLYWHPDRNVRFDNDCGDENVEDHKRPSPRYRREYDTYSLGIVLLEIGLWCPILRIFKDAKSDNLQQFSEEVKNRYVPQLRGRMGVLYAGLVMRCIEGDFYEEDTEGYVSTDEAELDDDIRSKHYLKNFERYVVSEIEKVVALRA